MSPFFAWIDDCFGVILVGATTTVKKTTEACIGVKQLKTKLKYVKYEISVFLEEVVSEFKAKNIK